MKHCINCFSLCLVLIVLLGGCGSNFSAKKMEGEWYAPGSSIPDITLYSDGTCEMSGEYGSGTWNVVNGNLLKMTNYYGEVETATIKSLSNKKLELSRGENTSTFYSTPQEKTTIPDVFTDGIEAGVNHKEDDKYSFKNKEKHSADRNHQITDSLLNTPAFQTYAYNNFLWKEGDSGFLSSDSLDSFWINNALGMSLRSCYIDDDDRLQDTIYIYRSVNKDNIEDIYCRIKRLFTDSESEYGKEEDYKESIRFLGDESNEFEEYFGAPVEERDDYDIFDTFRMGYEGMQYICKARVQYANKKDYLDGVADEIENTDGWYEGDYYYRKLYADSWEVYKMDERGRFIYYLRYMSVNDAYAFKIYEYADEKGKLPDSSNINKYSATEYEEIFRELQKQLESTWDIY